MAIRSLFRIGSLLTLAVLLPHLALAQTQDGKVKRRPHQTNAAAAERADADAGRKAEGGDKVEQLQAKVEQLQALIEQQQRALAEMQKSIRSLTSKTPVLTPASAQVSSADSQTLTPPIVAASAQTNKSASPSSPAQKGTGFRTFR